MWVEFRCRKCGKTTVQSLDIIGDELPMCQPNLKHRDWVDMKRSPGASIADSRRATQLEIEAMREELVA